MAGTKVYLAIPYSFNPDTAYRIANIVAANLMQQGYIVFSPISHSHPVAEYLPTKLKTDSDWWMTQDLPFVEWADEIRVVSIGSFGSELIAESKGVCMEIAHAKLHNKKIIFHEHDD